MQSAVARLQTIAVNSDTLVLHSVSQILQLAALLYVFRNYSQKSFASHSCWLELALKGDNLFRRTPQ